MELTSTKNGPVLNGFELFIILYKITKHLGIQDGFEVKFKAHLQKYILSNKAGKITLERGEPIPRHFLFRFGHFLKPRFALFAVVAASVLVFGAYAQGGDPLVFFLKFGSSGAGNGQFSAPEGIAVNSTHILVVETGNHRVQIFDQSGNFKAKFSSFGSGDGQFSAPRGIAVNSTHILVADKGNSRVQIFDQSGNFKAKFGSSGSGDGQFSNPFGIAVNSGTIFVADSSNQRVQLFIPSLQDGSSVEMRVDDGGTANVKLPSDNTISFTFPAGKTGTFTAADSDSGSSAAGLVFLGGIVNLDAPANTCTAGCTIVFRFTDADLSAAGLSGPTDVKIFHDANDDGNFSLDEELATTVSPTSAPGPYTATATTTSTSKFGIGGTPPPADEESGGGGCKGDCTPPSFSVSFGQDEYALAIGDVTYQTLQYYNEAADTAVLETHTTVPVRLLVFEDGGSDNVQHIALYMNLRGLERQIHDSDTYIIYDKATEITVSDPNGFFSDVGFSASQKGNKLEATFDITFAKPMERSDLILYVWDARANAAQVRILDALEVVWSENIKDTSIEDVTTESQTVADQQIASLVTKDHQIEVIKMWAGYLPEYAQDSDVLGVIGFDGTYIPHWVKKFFGKKIYDDQLQVEDLRAALEYLISMGVVK